MIYKIYKWLKEKDEDIASGLVYGFAFGIVVGLAFGLGLGIVYGIVVGLAFGLGLGIVYGLVYGLAFGLGLGIVNLPQILIINPITIILLIISILILSEILFGFNKKEKMVKWSKVILLKLDAVFTSLLIIINLLNIIWIARQVRINFDIVLKWVGYIGTGMIILIIAGVIIYLWLLWNKERLTKPKK